MLQNWVRPLKLEQYSAFKTIPNNLGSKTSFFPKESNSSLTQIAILGNHPDASNLIRNQLYSFQSIDNPLNIYDLGDIRNNQNDFLIQVCSELISSNIIPILIGLNEPMLKAQVISASNSIGQCNMSIFSPNLFYDAFLSSKPEQLNSLQWIGKQVHQMDLGKYASSSIINMGQIRNNINEIEPNIRESNTYAFSIEALRFSDAPAQKGCSGSALSLAEACQLMRFVGFNEKLTSISFDHYLHEKDANGTTANAIAQLIWYLLEGISKRTIEDLTNTERTQHFSINLDESDHIIQFVKSTRTGRWWVKLGEYAYHACSYDDYLEASQNRISDRVFNYLKEIQ